MKAPRFNCVPWLVLAFGVFLKVESFGGPVTANSARQTYVISVTFGKSFSYSPVSNEAFHWGGSLRLEHGELLWIDKLLYARTDWSRGWSGCAREYSHRLATPEWRSEIVPGSGNGTEGIRFSFRGDSSSRVTIATVSRTVSFTMNELIEKEILEFHCGGYYSGQPIMVFLGHDPRIRVTRKSYLAGLQKSGNAGGVVLPDDFDGEKRIFLSTYCALILPEGISTAQFDIASFGLLNNDTCLVHLQLLAARDTLNTLEVMDDWMDLRVSINGVPTAIRRFFDKFRMVQKMQDVYLPVPRKLLRERGNQIRVENRSGRYPLLVHRIFVNDPPPSLSQNVKRLPPLPSRPTFWIGFDENTLAPQNGEVDEVLKTMGEEQAGNYMLFRVEEAHTAGAADYERWADLMARYNMKAGIVGTTDTLRVADATMRRRLGADYLGIHEHERSNLIYGWGDPEPAAKRVNRTLPECEQAYLKRVGGIQILGQALPITHLDYTAGVQLVFSEPPTGHSTLMFASQRGAVYAYDTPLWGVHNANHIPRVPADFDTERRNFILLWQAWLYGARLIYDEEFALYLVHDAPRGLSDAFQVSRRKQMQELYHYASSIDLGNEEVSIGFLQGQYDCLVGGLQSDPDVARTKFWGMIGPETAEWEFNTPERGWELLGTFMPGVWLYPVLQDPRSINQFFGGSPHGQVDLVPINARPEKLSKYRLLLLPGWNTMTEDVYARLITYVRGGGHLLLSAAQCTKHVTRDILKEKRDFQWYAGGDLSALGGIRIQGVGQNMRTIAWADGSTCPAAGLPGLMLSTTTATVLAADENGNPVLVENRIGEGRVWMLTVGEYWGAASLDLFRNMLMERLLHVNHAGMRLTGESSDVDWHVYDCPGGWKRVVLLNTDWTSAGNVKRVVLEADGLKIPLDVVEGTLKQVLLRDGVALVSAMPGTSVSPDQSGPGVHVLRLGGVGSAVMHLVSGRRIARLMLNGQEIGSDDNIAIAFGESWKEMVLEVVPR